IAAFHLLAKLCTLWLQHIAYPLLGFCSFFLRCSFGVNYFTDNLTFENPNFYADDSVGSARFGSCVINICTQCVQRHTTFAIPLATRNLGTTQATTNLDFNALCALTHSILNRALHGTTEHHTTLKLLCNALRYQSCI